MRMACICTSQAASSAWVSMKMRLVKCFSRGSDMFSPMERSITSPLPLRSSVAKEKPWAMASPGDLISTFSPST